MKTTSVKCLRMMGTAIFVMFLSAQTIAQKNDSIDCSQFVMAYDFVTNTTDGVGNAVKDSVRLAVVVGEHTAKCAEEKLTVVVTDMIIPKKVNVYQPLELE